MLTDPIADMLTRIRNANTAMHDEVRDALVRSRRSRSPRSSRRRATSSGSGRAVDQGPRRRADHLDEVLAPTVTARSPGSRRISTPGLRVYRKADAVPRVLGGLGVAVLSTSQGLMTDREARKRKVGGEVLCYVW